MRTSSRHLLRSLALFISLIASSRAESQASGGSPTMSGFSIALGVSHYDLDHKGSTPFGAIRLALPLATFVLEGSLGAFRPELENGEHRTFLIPETQLQWQLFPIFVKPYLGAGVGWFKAVSGPSPRRDDLTFSASAGVRLGIPIAGLSFRGEARARTIGSSDGSAVEWTIGIGK
jgi:hypothetical protein